MISSLQKTSLTLQLSLSQSQLTTPKFFALRNCQNVEVPFQNTVEIIEEIYGKRLTNGEVLANYGPFNEKAIGYGSSFSTNGEATRIYVNPRTKEQES